MTGTSLEQLLRELINSHEVEKGTLICALLKALREACNMYDQSTSVGSLKSAKAVRNILDDILSSGSYLDDAEWEDEFVESSPEMRSSTVDDSKSETFVSSIKSNTSKTSSTTKTSTTPKTSTTSKTSTAPKTTQSNSAKGPINNKIEQWNNSIDTWMKLPQVNMDKGEDVVQLVKEAAALKWNLCSGSEPPESLKNFNEFWQQLQTDFSKAGYRISPDNFISLNSVEGRGIYTCRGRITETETELLRPGVVFQNQELLSPVSVVTLPTDNEFPSDHVNSDQPAHWRGILGELELLAEHVEMQTSGVFAAIEGINKGKVETLEGKRSAILNELNRRGEVLRTTISKEDETPYRLATDYWRVEECFWSIFHDDGRGSGFSYFDRLRNRIQAWRTTLRRTLKFNIRDFSCGSDTLASVNKYIGNIILCPKRDIAPGTVIRELRPAILVNVQSTSRLLKGRVVAT